MALTKLTYVDNVTVIPARNLNAIQDSIIELEENSGNGVPTNVRQAIYTLLNSGAYATTGLTDEIAVVESWAEQVTSLTISPTTLSLSNNTPQTITATVVPSGSTVSWSSSDTSVATVVAGVVTGVGNGTCTITASAGGISKTCAVTVSGFATLESISAVYTQSGTVYDTYLTSTLIPDLVVTATYSDTSTETVPSTDYTLSGTLEAGTSTITVSYGGKTTTFNVTVTSRIPSTYRQVEYLQSDGTQGITTDIIPRDTRTIVTFEYLAITASADNFITGVFNSNNQRYYPAFVNNEGNFLFMNRSAAASPRWTNAISINVKHTVDFNNASHQALFDGDVKLTDATFAITSENNKLAIFCRGHNSTDRYLATASTARIYSLKCEDNGTGNAIGEFIPCYRKSDNVGGFYDLVTETFYTDVISGNAFTWGPEMWED